MHETLINLVYNAEGDREYNKKECYPVYRKTNLALPMALVCRIRHLRWLPYAIFIFIP
jgi:hypothetical protein